MHLQTCVFCCRELLNRDDRYRYCTDEKFLMRKKTKKNEEIMIKYLRENLDKYRQIKLRDRVIDAIVTIIDQIYCMIVVDML